MKDLLTTESIVRLLDKDLDMSLSTKLAYRQVFPAEYVPETVQDGKTYICFDVDIQRSMNKTYLYPVIYVWVFAHRSNLFLPNGGGVITDKLCAEISNKLNGSMFYGMGELELYSVKRFAPMTDYQGKVMTFNAKDFSRAYSGKKQIPTNRKNNYGYE